MMATARRICVTGATKAGRVTVTELREHGYQVIATDTALTADDVAAGVLKADLTDYGQATEALRGADAVVHLANIPAPGRSTPAVTFNANVAMNFNVFHAAAALGLTRVVWASSETTLGLPFGGPAEQFPGVAGQPPRYAPVDEDHFPVPTTTYALSKVASETIAEQISRWSGSRSWADPQHHGDRRLRAVPVLLADPHLRKWNLWGYVDVRDVAAACRLGLEADVTGSQNVIIAAADTVMNRPSRDVLAEVLPGVRVTREIGEFGTLLAVDRARQVLGTHHAPLLARRVSSACASTIHPPGPETSAVEHLPKVLDGPGKPFPELDRRLPAQQLLGAADVGTAADWIVGGQRPVLDGQLPPVSARTFSASSSIVNSPGLPRLTGPTSVGEFISRDEALDQVVDVAERPRLRRRRRRR